MRMTRHSVLGAGKTLGWAGATPPLGAFSRPKTPWGRSSPPRPSRGRVLAAPRAKGRRVCKPRCLTFCKKKGRRKHGHHQSTTQAT